jgi:hypothetical protein
LQLLFDTDVERRPLLSPRVGDEPSQQVDEAVRHTPVAAMLDLRDVPELIHHALDDGAPAQHDPVEQRPEPVPHPDLEAGDELHAFVIQRLEERLRDVALITEELAEQPLDQLRHGSPIVRVARRQPHREQFAAVIDNQVELEAEEPVHARPPAPRAPREDLVRVDAPVVADLQGSRVHEPAVADEAGEGPHVPLEHALGVVSLEVAVAGGVEERDDRHHLRQAERGWPAALARLKQALPPERFKEQAEVVYVAEEG